MTEVQIHGAGWAGRLIAVGLAARGVDVRLVDLGAGASAQAVGLGLPCHVEHPHRLEAALGTARAAELVAFIQESLGQTPGFVRTGVTWRPAGREREELAASQAAAARLGLKVGATADGYVLEDGGVVDLAALTAATACPVAATPVPAEVNIWATGAAIVDPYLEDKLTPVRVQAMRFVGAELPPTVTWHAMVRWCGAWASGARVVTPTLEVGEVEARSNAVVSAALERISRQFFPHLGPVAEERVGIVATTCDGLPIVGPIPGRPREILCLGLGELGLSYAAGVARAVVEGVLEGRPTFLPSCLRTDRFR